MVVSALVGGAGLLPTMAAIEAGRTLALANKETLVMAGSLMTAAARARGVALLPVDSEHSAVFQCLVGHNRGDVHRILLTASGGPFRERPPEKFAGITVEDALKHPTWKMGAKITIDSATLMNKGLEIIEARWLFDLVARPGAGDRASPVDRALHGRVRRRLRDRPARRRRHGRADSLCADVSRASPDPAPRLDLTRTGALTFFPPDPGKFPCLRLARTALEQGGTAPSGPERGQRDRGGRLPRPPHRLRADPRAHRARPDGLAGGGARHLSSNAWPSTPRRAVRVGEWIDARRWRSRQ